MSAKPHRPEGMIDYTDASRRRLLALARAAFDALPSGEDFSIEYLMDRAFIAASVRGCRDEAAFARDVGALILTLCRGGMAARTEGAGLVKMWGKA